MNLEESRRLDYDSKSPKRQKDTHHNEEKLRKPKIIYVETPEIIHAEADHFMSLVQELTGRNSNSESSLKYSPSTASTLMKEKEKFQVKRDDNGAFPHRSLASSVRDDQMVSTKSDDQTDCFYQSLVEDAIDLYLSPPC